MKQTKLEQQIPMPKIVLERRKSPYLGNLTFHTVLLRRTPVFVGPVTTGCVAGYGCCCYTLSLMSRVMVFQAPLTLTA